MRNEPVPMYNAEDRINYIHACLAYRKVSKALIREVLKYEYQCIREILEDGGELCMTGVGVFRQAYKPARDAYDWEVPWCDGDVVYHIPYCDEHNRVVFHTFKSLKDRVKEASLGNPVPHYKERLKRNHVRDEEKFAYEEEVIEEEEGDEFCEN